MKKWIVIKKSIFRNKRFVNMMIFSFISDVSGKWQWVMFCCHPFCWSHLTVSIGIKLIFHLYRYSHTCNWYIYCSASISQKEVKENNAIMMRHSHFLLSIVSLSVRLMTPFSQRVLMASCWGFSICSSPDIRQQKQRYWRRRQRRPQGNWVVSLRSRDDVQS